MKKVFLAVFLALAPVGAAFALNASGTISTTGNTTLVSAVSRRRIVVNAFSLTSTSTVPVTAAFQSGASGSQIWGVALVSPSTGTVIGANLAVPEKQGSLFKTAPGDLLNLNLSATPSQSVIWAVSYTEE
jgi:hypothetical protein